MKRKKSKIHKHPSLNVNFKLGTDDGQPVSPRVILPNTNGDAIGMNIDTDTCGAGIAMPQKVARVIRYGVAYAPNGGETHAGAQGAAVSHGGLADSGDGGIAYTWNGLATAYQWSVAFSLQGDAAVQQDAVAVALTNGLASVVGGGGVACALNLAKQTVTLPDGTPSEMMTTDPETGAMSAGNGSVMVAFGLDENGHRCPVVGFIGGKPDFLKELVNLESKLLRWGVQFGLKPNVKYRLNSKTNQFEEVPKSKRKKK